MTPPCSGKPECLCRSCRETPPPAPGSERWVLQKLAAHRAKAERVLLSDVDFRALCHELGRPWWPGEVDVCGWYGMTKIARSPDVRPGVFAIQEPHA